MTHSSAIKTVTKLLPAIKSGSASAESVLLKHARENDLPVAQLEKLAQVFNTMRTITFMDKSAAKGDTFDVVDIPGLLSDYGAHDFPKAASANAKPVVIHNRVPNLIGETLQTPGFQTKYASQFTDDTQVKKAAVTIQRELREEKAAAERISVDFDIAEDVHLQAFESVEAEMQKFAKAVRGNGPEFFAMVEHDMLGEFEDSDEIKAAFDLAADFCGASRFRTPIKRASELPDTRKLTSDRFNLKPTFKTMSEGVSAMKNARAFQEELSKEANQLAPERRRTFNQAAGRSNRGQAGGRAPTAQAGMSRSNAPVAGGGGEIPGTPSPQEMAALLQQLQPRSAPPKNMLTVANEGLIGGEKALLDTLQGIGPAKNVRQEARDVAAEEVRHTTNIERLLVTDPVLSEADPAKVISLFNSIREHSPHVAKDINAIRMALRESVQHQGLTPDVIDTMVGINTNHGKGRLQDATLKGMKYGLK